ncbi:MAG: molybdopterin-dependent oxidoreductase [Candidatus Eisenbacteria bacterium]|nr:molybdopterin-dependent oxidoreductase [Candidatus Eisenbacteria bacterium]
MATREAPELESKLPRIPKGGFTRRSFLQGMGATAALVFWESVAGGGLRLLGARPAEAAELGEWIYSCCNQCGGQTGIQVHVIDGMVRFIAPSPHNPISIAAISDDFHREKVNGGRMCPKGNTGIRTLYDPDRLKAPMRRKGERGSGEWEAISWDEAIGYAAERLDAIRKQYGPEALVWFSEDHSFVNPQADFCQLFGTPNYLNHSNLCDVSRKRGFSTVMGDERPLPDLAHSDYVMLFGWNPLSAIKWCWLPRAMRQGRQGGGRLVVVDPVFTHTAAKADEWVPIRPGTDGALALAIGHVLVEHGLYNRKFVREWTVGFDEYAKYVRDKTPRWAEDVTSVPAATIERLAKEIAAARAPCIDAWSGPGHHTNATQGARAIAILPALLGAYDRPGTMIMPDRKGAKRRTLNVDKPKAARSDGLGTTFPFGHGSGIYVQAREAMITGKPYPVKAAVFVMQNWVMSVPGRAKNIEAIRNMEFVMAVDTMMSETADLADLVVPGSHYLERYDLTGNWVTFPSVTLRQPVVKSWIGGMPEYEFVFALGRKLELKDKDGKGFDMTYKQYLSDELKGGIGITLDELKALPGAVWIGGSTSYKKYAGMVTPPAGSTVDDATHVVKGPDGKAVGLSTGGFVIKGFNTPSRKIELVSKQLADKGYDALPAYTDPVDKPTSEYPLALVAWKQAEHTHTRTFNNPYLMEMKPDNPLWINTETAKNLGIADGDRIVVESPHAKAEGTARVTECIHPEVVGLHHGYGHWALGSVAKGKGMDDGQFMPGKADPISGQAVTKEIGVRVRRA